MKYKLIFGKNKPRWWKEGDPVNLIVEDGQHYCDFDLITEGLSEDLISRAEWCAECAVSKKKSARHGADWREILPMGINRIDIIRHGIKLEVILEV